MRGGNLVLSLVRLVAIAMIGCAADKADPFSGVLHPVDSGLDMLDSAVPQVDSALPDANDLNDAGVDANVNPEVDAGQDSGVDAGPISPLDGTEPTNMPNSIVEYGGAELNPGLTFLGTHLEIDGLSTGLSIDFYARIRNDFNDTLCAFSLNIDLLDDNGALLTRRLRTLQDLEPHTNSSLGLSDCVSPGDIFYVYATDFVENAAGTVTLEDVAVIEWTYSLGGYLDTYFPANRASASNLTVEPSDYDTFVLTGRITNNTGTALAFPSIVAYVLNRGNQPLHRLTDITSSPISGYGNWEFETGLYRYAFTPADVDYRIDYLLP